jgi:hypothetical protein
MNSSNSLVERIVWIGFCFQVKENGVPLRWQKYLEEYSFHLFKYFSGINGSVRTSKICIAVPSRKKSISVKAVRVVVCHFDGAITPLGND